MCKSLFYCFFLLLRSDTYRWPYSTCDLVTHLVKKKMKVTLIRELTMNTSGIHTPFIKETHSDVLYYADPVEVICEHCTLRFTANNFIWLPLWWSFMGSSPHIHIDSSILFPVSSAMASRLRKRWFNVNTTQHNLPFSQLWYVVILT